MFAGCTRACVRTDAPLIECCAPDAGGVAQAAAPMANGGEQKPAPEQNGAPMQVDFRPPAAHAHALAP